MSKEVKNKNIEFAIIIIIIDKIFTRAGYKSNLEEILLWLIFRRDKKEKTSFIHKDLDFMEETHKNY